MSLSAVSLFSGCGGFCEGVERAGFELKVAVEMDRFAAETYRFNFPKTPLIEGDVRAFLAPDAAADIRKYGLNELDLVFGGPPCQGFSQIGTRDLSDHRNDLYLEFVRALKVLQPRVFLMENVPNLLLMEGGHYKNLILEALRAAGYSNTIYLRVLASDYGVPQDRRRVFFVGVNDNYEFPHDLEAFAQSALQELVVKTPVTVWDALSDLPEDVVPSGEVMPYPKKCNSRFQEMMRLDRTRQPYSKEIKLERGIRHFESVELHNHHTKEIQKRRASLIAMLAPGAKADSLPKHIWNGARPEKWRRLDPDAPAYTILANMHRDLSEFVHPKLQRWITVREAARLQSFHDGFVFRSSEWQMLKQIGNAVPPLLGRAMGHVAHSVLQEVSPKAKKRRGARKADARVQIELPL